MRMKSIALVAIVLAASAASCGGQAAAKEPSPGARRDVAERFARAILRGDAGSARSRLLHPDDAALVALVRRAARPWRVQHATARVPGRHSGARWTFRYAGRRTERDGRFQTQSGELVLVVAASADRAGVVLFTFRHVQTRFSTHHDAQLLPSKR
jgi:hypothetical protein